LGDQREPLQDLQPQDGRQRPHLADGQRRIALEAAGQALQHVQLHLPVGLVQRRPGEADDAQRPGRPSDAGELPHEAWRQVLGDLPKGPIDDVGVVQQPLGRQREPLRLRRGLGEPSQGEV
jgi:hypothetical protein